MRVFFIIQILSFLLSDAYAGGWVSGGAELIKDSHNPWFLNNTKIVNYCVLIDKKNFGADEELVKRTLEKAIIFWKNEFSLSSGASHQKLGELRVATQEFKEVKCEESVSDIKFQFGVLDPIQKRRIVNPQRFVGLAIRTNYNHKTLKGSGFVYISPISGQLAFNQLSTHDLWRKNDGKFLLFALIHELGHVFGLSHSNTIFDIMSESFVENLILPSSGYENVEPHYFTLIDKSNTICLEKELLKTWKIFFELSADENCFQFKFNHSRSVFNQSQFILFTGKNKESLIEKMSMKLDLNSYHPMTVNSIWLPQDQGVIKSSDYTVYGSSFVYGSSLISISKVGSFSTLANRQRKILFTFSQGAYSVTLVGFDEYGNIINLL